MLQELTLTVLLVIAQGTSLAMAADPEHGIKLSPPWSLELPPVVPNGAAYLSIHNQGHHEDRLIRVTTPIAKQAQLHSHIEKNGVMRMQAIEDGMAVPAQGIATFAPGGNHIMLMKLNEPLTTGMRYPMTLHFERAGAITVEVEVLSMDAAAARRKTAAQGHDTKTGHATHTHTKKSN